MPRPTMESVKNDLYLKEQCGLVENFLNQLEQICKTPNLTKEEDRNIGLLVGKAMITFTNIENAIGVFNEN